MSNFWKQSAAGIINTVLISQQDVEKRQKKRLLLDYLSDNLKHHNWWAYRYFFCEFLALINVIGKKIYISWSKNSDSGTAL